MRDSLQSEPSKVWVEQIKAHLDLLNAVCGRVPSGERLEAQDLNEILRLFQESRGKFLLICELYDFKIQQKQD